MSKLKNDFECYFLLFLSLKSEKLIREFLIQKINVNEESIERNMHLTIYYGRRKLPIDMGQSFLSIDSDVTETRFMVLAPGGENPHPDHIASQKSIGIRLTKRNSAIPDILKLRRQIYRHESKFIKRQNTTDWKNAFGARNYQPHIKLLRPGTSINNDLSIIGNKFREYIKIIEFSKLVQRDKY